MKELTLDDIEIAARYKILGCKSSAVQESHQYNNNLEDKSYHEKTYCF